MAVGPPARDDAAAQPIEGYPASKKHGINFKGINWMTRRGDRATQVKAPMTSRSFTLGADQIHKTLELKVTTSAKADRQAKLIDDRDT